MNAPSLLIVGAAPDSLGDAVLTAALEGPWEFANITTAGINNEDLKMDVTNHARVHEVLSGVRPDIIVCTVGVNEPCGILESNLQIKMYDAFHTNVLGPIDLLRDFVTSPVHQGREGIVKKFVAISSNSAHIPRTSSMPYCASKAAFSMALRVAARELASRDDRVCVWGYEPGLLAGTPMTESVSRALPSDQRSEPVPLHRMKGVPLAGIPVQDLARMIIRDVADYSVAMNGVLIPFNADEL